MSRDEMAWLREVSLEMSRKGHLGALLVFHDILTDAQSCDRRRDDLRTWMRKPGDRSFEAVLAKKFCRQAEPTVFSVASTIDLTARAVGMVQ